MATRACSKALLWYTWQHAEPAAQHIAPKVYTGESVQVVAHCQRKQRAQAQQRHKFEAIAADGAIYRRKALVAAGQPCNLRGGVRRVVVMVVLFSLSISVTNCRHWQQRDVVGLWH